MQHIRLFFIFFYIAHVFSSTAYDVGRNTIIRTSRNQRGVSVIAQPAWRIFEHNKKSSSRISALVATVKIRTRLPLQPGALTFTIETKEQEEYLPKEIGATLFIKEKNLFTTKKEERLIPLQEQFLAQGMIDPKKKTVTFLLPKKIVSKEEFYIIMSFPQHAQKNVKGYTFSYFSSY